MEYLIIAPAILAYIHIGSMICARRSSQGYEITKTEYYLTLFWPLAIVFAIGIALKGLISKK